MKASVIIPTMNRAHLLGKLLKSLSDQDISSDDFEVIIVDNGSVDDTKDVCKKYSVLFNNFIYLYDERPGLHIGRNLGYLKSSSDILIYGDDDIIVPKNWISSIISAFDDPEVVLVGGNNIPDYEDTPPSWVLDLWESDSDGNNILLPFSCIDLGNKRKLIKANYVFGCNFSVRKEIIKLAKGFHPDGVPRKYLRFRGDGETFISEFITTNNLKTLFLPEASVKHYVSKTRMTHKYVEGIAFRNGISSRFYELRQNTSVMKAVKDYLKLLVCRRKNHFIKGNMFLLRNFILSKKLRNWVKLDNFLNESISDYL